MSPWTCPNTKCTYDSRLQPGQYCPLCGKDAREFHFGQFGNLLIDKKDYKAAIDRKPELKRVLDKIKYCPTCGSHRIFWAYGLPQLWSLWECRECGYRGAFVIEDGNIAAKLRKDWNKGRRKEIANTNRKRDNGNLETSG